MTETGTLLEVQDLQKTFRTGKRETRAVRGLSLTVDQGEFVAIMGPSGCGKSTLLHLIAGIARPTGGVIRLNGTDVQSLSGRKAALMRRDRVGYIFQDLNLLESLSVRENILLPRLLGGRSRTDIDPILQSLQITHLAGDMPGNLSGGERQRVAIARAMAMNPSIILADEPTGNLDFSAGQEFCQLLQQTQQQMNVTIVMVTHEVAVARWAHRVIVVRDGQTVGEIPNADQKTADELAHAYRTILDIEGDRS